MCCTVQILSLLTSRPEKEIIRDITQPFLPRSTHLRHRLWVSTQPESFSNRTSSPVTVLTVNRWQKLINHEVVNVSKTKERERGEKPDGQINRKTSSLGKRTKKTETDWAEIKSMNKKKKTHPHPSVGSHREKVKGWLMTRVPSVIPDISLNRREYTDISRTQNWTAQRCLSTCRPK